MPETRRHLELRTALFQILQSVYGRRATVGSEQFVYWDPTDPAQCCAPDVMLRLGEPDAPFDVWKVWERGAPHIAIEIISDSDSSDHPWEAKLERYRHVGVKELVRFDGDDSKHALRIWDAVEGDLVERAPAVPEFAYSAVLEAYFCVRDGYSVGPMLRLSRDAEGRDLFPTPQEARQAEAEARERAEARVRELEAELQRRGR
ncbi:MAG TPA: Uma2 family endonuclease [Polyangiaceae bacterium]